MIPPSGIPARSRRLAFAAPVAGAAILAFLAGALCGCSSVTVYRLVEQRYPPKPKDYPIKLYEGKVRRSHLSIAFIDSQPLPDQSDASRKKQLIQIRDEARRLGADAVDSIDLNMVEKVQGLVADQQVPFKAYKQGRYKLYFIRGTAIVYTRGKSEPSELTPPAPETAQQEPTVEPQEPPVLAPLVDEPSPKP